MEKQFSDIKVWVKSLTVACPLDDVDSECPVKNLRELPLIERLSAVDELSSVQLVMIIKHHSKCLEIREQ